LYKVKGKNFIVEEYLGCFEVQAKSRPTVRVGSKVISAARFVYEECFGEVPEGLLVRHKCDNAYCINPEHLEIGTHQDNMNDLTKKRMLNGRNSRHMLDDEEARLAKFLHENRGLDHYTIAKSFNVPASSVFISLNKR
jgi:HNH endonuclease